MPIDFGTGWLSGAVASFAEKYETIDLEIHVNGRWVDVSEETYDVAIHLGNLMNSDVPCRRLTALTRGIYASPGYLKRHVNTPKKLSEVKGVMTEQQLAEGIWTLENPTAEVGHHGRVVVNNIGMARQLVINGIGAGVLPNVMCHSDVQHGRLVKLQLDQEIPALQATATYFSGRYLPRRTRALSPATDKSLPGSYRRFSCGR